VGASVGEGVHRWVQEWESVSIGGGKPREGCPSVGASLGEGFHWGGGKPRDGCPSVGARIGQSVHRWCKRRGGYQWTPSSFHSLRLMGANETCA
jgi:hypothetical protein